MDASYVNARGELVMPYHIYKAASPDALKRATGKGTCKPHIRRREHRIANGTLNPDGSRR